MIVRCINDIGRSGSLTKGALYEVERETEENFYLRNEKIPGYSHMKKRFEIVRGECCPQCHFAHF